MDTKGYSAVVYFHEVKVDPPMLLPLVAAIPLENLDPVNIGHLTEKTICMAKYRKQEALCIILDIKKGKSLEQLRAELNDERTEEYEEKGRRWADELKQKSQQPRKKAVVGKHEDKRPDVAGRTRSTVNPAPTAMRTTPYPKRERGRSTMSPDSDRALSEEISDKSTFLSPKVPVIRRFQSLRPDGDDHPLGTGICLRTRMNRGQSVAVGSSDHRASILRGASRRRSASVYQRKSRAKSQAPGLPNLLNHAASVPEVHTFIEWGENHGVDIVGLQEAVSLESNVGPAFSLALHTLFTENELKDSLATPAGATNKRVPMIEQERLKIALALLREYCQDKRKDLPNAKQLSRFFSNAKKETHMSLTSSTSVSADMDEDMESQHSAIRE